MLVALLVLLVTLWAGGWEFALPCALSFAMARFRRVITWRDALLTGAGGLFWLAALKLTANRQLYFPYTLYWSMAAALVWTGLRGRLLGAAAIFGVFTAVRLVQDVTSAVLIKELIVASLAIALALSTADRNPGAARRFAAAAIASIAAFAGLAV